MKNGSLRLAVLLSAFFGQLVCAAPKIIIQNEELLKTGKIQIRPKTAQFTKLNIPSGIWDLAVDFNNEKMSAQVDIAITNDCLTGSGIAAQTSNGTTKISLAFASSSSTEVAIDLGVFNGEKYYYGIFTGNSGENSLNGTIQDQYKNSFKASLTYRSGTSSAWVISKSNISVAALPISVENRTWYSAPLKVEGYSLKHPSSKELGYCYSPSDTMGLFGISGAFGAVYLNPANPEEKLLAITFAKPLELNVGNLIASYADYEGLKAAMTIERP